MIKKFWTKRRKGALMSDVVIAIFIVVTTVIPVAATINYAYSLIVSSANVSMQINEFGDCVDEMIWNHMDNPGLHPLQTTTFTTKTGKTATLTMTALPGDIQIVLPTFIDAHMEAVKFGELLKAGRRNTQTGIYMLKRKP